MIWMGIVMGLPLLGLGLFFVYPWQVALPPYLVLTGASLFFDWLMMSAMHLSVRSGREEMIGSMAEVLSWAGHSGQVIWRGEIWHATTEQRTAFMPGERVVINRVSGLTLSVKPIDSKPDGFGPRTGDRLHLADVPGSASGGGD